MRIVSVLALWLVLASLIGFQYAEGWGYSSPNAPLPDQWAVLYPTCRDSAVYPQSPSPLVPTGALESSWDEVESAATLSASLTTSRPQVGTTSTTVTAQIAMNIPGLMVGTVLDAGFLLQFQSTWYRFQKFLLRSGVEHGVDPLVNVSVGASGSWTSTRAIAEVQFQFAPVDSVGSRQALSVSIPLYPTSDMNGTSTFVSELLKKLSALTFTSSSTSNGNGARTTTGVVELFPSNVTSNSTQASNPTSWIFPSASSRGAFFYYAGSATTPPCESSAWLVSRHRVGITPADLSSLVALTGAQGTLNATRPLQSQKIFVKALVTLSDSMQTASPVQSGPPGAPTPSPTLSVTPNPVNERMRKVLIVLISVVILQVLLVAALIAARRELISLPTTFGGLAKPLEFWSNPTSHHTWEDVESENEEEEEGSSEGEGSDEEGEEGSAEESAESSEWSFHDGGQEN